MGDRRETDEEAKGESRFDRVTQGAVTKGIVSHSSEEDGSAPQLRS